MAQHGFKLVSGNHHGEHDVQYDVGRGLSCGGVDRHADRGIHALECRFHRYPIPSLKAFVGAMIFGWGLFNLVEGIIDHQLLAIHYVRQVPNYTVYNLTFLVIGGVAFILIGWLLMKDDRGNVSNQATGRI